MAKRSPLLEQLLRDMWNATEASDIGFIERTTSHEEGVVAIGSDPAEVAEGYDQIIPLMRSSTPEGELGIRTRIDDVKAYEEGDTGWGHGRGRFETDGKSVDVRFTAVLHREDGEWKVVQFHSSIGVPNDRMFDPALQGGAGART
jgi:ketosteroid isomerase-like protein